MNDNTDLRLITLESRVAHHERMAEEISEVVARQALTIDALVGQVRMLKERLAEMSAGWPRASQDELPPPHY